MEVVQSMSFIVRYTVGTGYCGVFKVYTYLRHDTVLKEPPSPHGYVAIHTSWPWTSEYRVTEALHVESVYSYSRIGRRHTYIGCLSREGTHEIPMYLLACGSFSREHQKHSPGDSRAGLLFAAVEGGREGGSYAGLVIVPSVVSGLIWYTGSTVHMYVWM